MFRRPLVPLDDLRERLIDYPASGINAYRDHESFSVRGWRTHYAPTTA
jgi:hypothetical protein